MLLKEEISTIVETLPEDFQIELLQYLKKIDKMTINKAKSLLHFNLILTEDNDLLKKLAQ